MKVHLGLFRLPSLPGLPSAQPAPTRTAPALLTSIPVPAPEQATTAQPVVTQPAPTTRTLLLQPWQNPPTCVRYPCGDAASGSVPAPAPAPTPASVATAAFTPASLPSESSSAPAPYFTPSTHDLDTSAPAEPPAVSPVAVPATPPAPTATGGAFSLGGAAGAGVAGFFVAGPVGALVGLVVGGKLLGKKA